MIVGLPKSQNLCMDLLGEAAMNMPFELVDEDGDLLVRYRRFRSLETHRRGTASCGGERPGSRTE